MNRKFFLICIFSYFLCLGLTACSDDDEGECLAHGENCSQSYIDENYGGNRPPCCNSDDVCQESPSGYLTCN